ncbi:DUF1415 domain containing protein [Nitzschia inconspicua]|uniref:DUF1415 domain containing protein n=1 Tax=Nitzschia inconspicua TaxID=303405 RepID=A0A9K3Q227_9STRA|nr:DUF1415 domain containing protein [Nitzschia inconspicua]
MSFTPSITTAAAAAAFLQGSTSCCRRSHHRWLSRPFTGRHSSSLDFFSPFFLHGTTRQQQQYQHQHQRHMSVWCRNSRTNTNIDPAISRKSSRGRNSKLFSTINNNNSNSNDNKNSRMDNNDPHRRRILEDTSREDLDIVKDTLDWLQHVVMGLNLCPFAKPSLLSDQIRIVVIHGANPTDVLAGVLGECWKLQAISQQQQDPAMMEQDDNNIIISSSSSSTATTTRGGTTLVVCPDLYPDDFEEYLAIYNIFEQGVLVDQNLTGELQVAPFHPLFEFATNPNDDINDDDDDDDDNNDDDGDDTTSRTATAITESNPSNNTNDNDGDDDDELVAIEHYTNRSPYPIFHILREVEVSKAVESLEGDASRVWQRNIDLLQELEDEFLTPNNDDDDSNDDDNDELLRSVILKGKGKHDEDHAALWERVDKVLKRFKQKQADSS